MAASRGNERAHHLQQLTNSLGPEAIDEPSWHLARSGKRPRPRAGVAFNAPGCVIARDLADLRGQRHHRVQKSPVGARPHVAFHNDIGKTTATTAVVQEVRSDHAYRTTTSERYWPGTSGTQLAAARRAWSAPAGDFPVCLLAVVIARLEDLDFCVVSPVDETVLVVDAAGPVSRQAVDLVPTAGLRSLPLAALRGNTRGDVCRTTDVR